MEDSVNRGKSSCIGYGSLNNSSELVGPPPCESKRDWQRLIVGPIALIYIYAYMTAATNMTLYGPYAIGKILFPNETFNLGGKSLCEINTSSPEFQDYLYVQAVSSRLNVYFAVASGIPAVIANVFLGTFSDHFGRKFLFVVPIIGSLVKNVICIFGIYYEWNYYTLMTGFIVEGFSGIFLSFLQVCYSYVADVTSRDRERAFGITLMEMAVGIGVCLAGFTTGYIITWKGFVWPMIFASGFLAIDFLLVCFLLFETVQTSKEKRPMDCRHIFWYVREVFAFYYRADGKGKRWKYILCILIFFLSSLPVMGRQSVETLFQVDLPFCWDSVKIGWYTTIRSFAQQVVGMGLIKLLQIFMNEEGIAIWATITTIIGYVMEGFAKTQLLLFLSPVVGVGGVLTIPMMRSLMSKMTPDNLQGTMFGGVAAVETICTLSGSVIANAIYGATLSISPGFVFFVFAGLCLVSLILLILLTIIPKCVYTHSTMVEKGV